MKKFIVLLLIFGFLKANAQIGYTRISQRYNWLAGLFDALGIPSGDTPAFKTGQAVRAGAIFYDSTGVDSGLYVYSGLSWQKVGGITGDFWSLDGNASIDTSQFLGTTDSTALQIRVAGLHAGWVGHTYQTTNAPYTDYGPSYTGLVALGEMASDSSIQYLKAGALKDDFEGTTAIGSGALQNSIKSQNTAIGFAAMNRNHTGSRNVALGNGPLRFSRTGNFNTALGGFALEVQDGVNETTAVGFGALRANRNGVRNTAVGYTALNQVSTWVESIAVTAPGSGYTTASVTISAPDTATPGASILQATATAQLSGGQVVGITVTQKGRGYNIFDGPVTATITGDGTGAAATVTLGSGDDNTAVGYLSQFASTYGKRNTTFGAYAGQGSAGGSLRTFQDVDMTLIGYNATRGLSRAITTPFYNSTAIGSQARVDCDSCLVLGSPGVSTVIGATSAHASAKLDLVSTVKGARIFPMTAAQRLAIPSPAIGLFVFDTDSSSYFQNTASGWQNVRDGAGTSGVTTVDAFAATGDIKGLSITGSAIKMHPATGTSSGGVSITTQDFSGDKTFNDNLSIGNELRAQNGFRLRDPTASGFYVRLNTNVLTADRNHVFADEASDTIPTRTWVRGLLSGGSTPGIDDVLAIGQPISTSRTIAVGTNTLNFTGTNSLSSEPVIYHKPSFVSNYILAMSNINNGTSAKGAIDFREWSTGTGHTVTLTPVDDITASYELRLPEGNNEDTLATKAYARSVGGGAATDTTSLSARIERQFSLNLMGASNATVGDAETRYFFANADAWNASATIYAMTIDRTCTLATITLDLECATTAGSNEAWSIYVRNTTTSTDYLISAVSASTSRRTWSNNAINIPLTAGDKIVIKSITPTFATNPAGCRPFGYATFR